MKATFAVSYTDKPFPVGSAVASVSYALQGRAAGAAPITGSIAPGTAAIVLDLAADTYDYTLLSLAANGTDDFDGPQTGSVVVPTAQTVSLSIATGLSLQQ